MKKLLHPALLVLLGGALLRITVGSEVYLRYVKEGLRPMVIVTGAVLVLLGAVGLVREGRAWLRQPVLNHRRAADGSYRVEPHALHAHSPDDDGHGHGPGAGPRVAFLLGAPALALLFFAPPALGSYTASRDGAAVVVEQADYRTLRGRELTPLSMREFIGRSMHDATGLAGRQVVLTGFVSRGGGGADWHLNRLTVNCCAADARPLRVAVHASGDAPAADSWVQVTGRLRAGAVDARSPVPHLEVLSVTAVPAPKNPYADRAPELGS
ncbi:TIGR03943 family putative permease subunit [Kitasatospora sp. NPDC096147]|uniref:TIGR03943 family putative permease subunit n=1 Tax=Kitasatospora sp. NPDC096147 TaxID=3364093 RepID=UPI003819CEBD